MLPPGHRCDIAAHSPALVACALVAVALCTTLLACGPGNGGESPEGAAESESAEAVTRPNILLYLVDTLRADGLGAYGNPVVETPALDALAAQGALFENAFAQSSWTRASVASILTANYPPAHGAERRHALLSEPATLLSERLKEHGYRTGFITTNPNVGSFFGFGQGFDDVIELYERRETGRVQARELETPADEVIPLRYSV